MGGSPGHRRYGDRTHVRGADTDTGADRDGTEPNTPSEVRIVTRCGSSMRSHPVRNHPAVTEVVLMAK
jgi:hypothetical protein